MRVRVSDDGATSRGGAAPGARSIAAEGERRRDSVMWKLFSLTGVMPLGVFLVFHLGTYASLAGSETFARSPAPHPARSPSLYGVIAEVVLLGLPLLLHTLYGLKIMWEGSSSVRRYPTPRNWAVTFQRWSGVVALLFIGYHLYAFRIPLALGSMQEAELPTRLGELLSTTSEPGVPVPLLILLVGLAASVFHFTSGLVTFCAAWGIATSKRSEEALRVALALAGIGLFLVGTNAAVYFATGAPLTASFAGTRIFGGAEPSQHE